MSPQLDARLCIDYSEIFRDRRSDPRVSAMCRGFDCGDGWYGLLDSLCGEIKRRVEEERAPQVVARQVKEKYGTLRIYVSGGDDYVRGMLEMARRLSDVVCEECGKPVTYVPDLCPAMCPSHKLRIRPNCSYGHPTGASLSLRVLAGVQNPRWRFIADALTIAVQEGDSGGSDTRLPDLDSAIETDSLVFRMRGGDPGNYVAGMLRFAELYSMRCR